MPRDRQRRLRRIALAVAAALLGVALGLMGAVPAQAAPAGWGQFTFTGASRAWTGTLTQQASGFPVAQLTSTSVGGSSVGIQSGTSTYLSPLTAVGARYGSSQGQGYLNLRPNSQNGPPPSVTTYTFDRPTPTSGWTFVLGDIDADQVTITGTDATGRPVSPAAFGFRDVFNYCVPDRVDGSTSRATTDSDGAWSVDGLPPAQGYTARIVDVPDGFERPDDPTLDFDVDDSDVSGLDFELVPTETSPSPTPTPTLTPTPTPTPSSTTAAPTPTMTVTTDSDDSDSSSSSGLASTGGPSLLIGVGGALLVLAGVLSVAYGVRRRRRG